MSRPDVYSLLAMLWQVERQEAKWRAYSAAWRVPGSEKDLEDMQRLDELIRLRNGGHDQN